VGAVGVAEWAIRANSVTADELANLRSGLAIFKRGDFNVAAAGGIAPLPLLLAYWPAVFNPEATPEAVSDSCLQTLESIMGGRRAL
jgi:hypothetical protein